MQAPMLLAGSVVGCTGASWVGTCGQRTTEVSVKFAPFLPLFPIFCAVTLTNPQRKTSLCSTRHPVRPSKTPPAQTRVQEGASKTRERERECKKGP